VLSSTNVVNGATVPKLRPVQIKAGITDGISTEVLEGLEEGDQIVTGLLSGGDSGSRQNTPNPFGGGPFRRF
jgi:HlyD family secretion protein